MKREVNLDGWELAPDWMVNYIRSLATVAQHSRPLMVVVAPQKFFDTIPNSGAAEGAMMMLADGSDVIIMPEMAVDTGYWRDILAHEFAHVLHSTIDRMCNSGDIDPAAYENEVEQFAKVVGGLLQFAATYAHIEPDPMYANITPGEAA